jgi:aspartyl-tRNA(Asn)/glutamyl-tRNA(Gln) amidotransferase subunit A
VRDREEDLRPTVTRLVRCFNTLGWPALSIPCGITGSGFPIGLQIVGPPFQEAVILRLGYVLEKVSQEIKAKPLF